MKYQLLASGILLIVIPQILSKFPPKNFNRSLIDSFLDFRYTGAAMTAIAAVWIVFDGIN